MYDSDDDDEDEKDAEYFERSDEFEFPVCSVGDAKLLYQQVYQHCKDWRAACCNAGCDGGTPAFYVGESKVAPHRWIGYVGEKCWT